MITTSLSFEEIRDLQDALDAAMKAAPRHMARQRWAKLTLKLDKLRIVDFRPPNRVRKLTARNFSWRKDGAVQEFFLRRVIPEFFDAKFDLQGDEFRFVAGMLSRASMIRLRG